MEMKARKMKCRLGADCPHERELLFSDWMRYNLPSSKEGFIIIDIDFVLFNYKTKRMLIIEQKTNKSKDSLNSNVDWYQRNFLKIVSKLFRKLPEVENGWTFDNVHLIQFDEYDFKTGNCYFDNKIISETDLKEKLTNL